MSCSINTSRLSPVYVAVWLACGLLSAAHADEGDAPLGITRAVTLPAQAKGNPPIWAGRAYRQGVVSVANPYGAEAGAKILEQGGNADRRRGGDRLRAQRRRAAIGRRRRRRLHDDPPRRQTGQTFAIDTREKAPAGATTGMFVGVPNCVAAGRGRRRAGHGARHRAGARTLRPAVARHRAATGDQAGRRGLRGHAALRRRELQLALAEFAAVDRVLLPQRRGTQARGRVAGAEQAAGRDVRA